MQCWWNNENIIAGALAIGGQIMYEPTENVEVFISCGDYIGFPIYMYMNVSGKNVEFEEKRIMEKNGFEVLGGGH